jgi:hypothetical protein
MNVTTDRSGSPALIKQIKNMKQFSPVYLIKSAYNSAANAVARQMVCEKYDIKEISRREALRAGFKTGGELNEEVNQFVADGRAVPSREEFTAEFKRLCELHNVAFEGGIHDFLAGAWEMTDRRGSSNDWKNI